MNGGENGVTQNGGRYGAGQMSNGHQDNILQDEDRPESVQSNDSMCSGNFRYFCVGLAKRRWDHELRKNLPIF